MKGMLDQLKGGLVRKVRGKLLLQKVGDIGIRISENCFKKRMKKDSSFWSFGKFVSKFWLWNVVGLRKRRVGMEETLGIALMQWKWGLKGR